MEGEQLGAAEGGGARSGPLGAAAGGEGDETAFFLSKMD